MLKKLSSALFSTMVFFAGIHLLILAVVAIVERDSAYLNIFTILGIQGFLPDVFTITPAGDIISLSVMGLVFVLFFISRKKDK